MSVDSMSLNQLKINKQDLARAVEPIESARGLPNPCYTGADAFLRERDTVFAGGWACAGFAKDAPAAGDLFPFEFAGLPLLMIRGEDEEIRIFHNVCRHRGRILVETPGHVRKAVVCPYHAWTYAMDGRLIGTPHVGGPGKHSCPGFDRDSIGLKPVRSAVWFGLVFIDLSGIAEDFSEYIRPVAERWSEFEAVELVHAGADCTIEFELECNWKLAVENYCEAYHLPWVHPGLNKYSPLDRHYAIVEETYSGQGSESYSPTFPEGAPSFPNASGLSDFWQTGAEYIALYPNVLLGVHRDHFYAVLILPDGPDRTRERFEIYYYSESVRSHEFELSRKANRELWLTIFAEDRDAVESMQRGRSSPGFDGGVFSPAMDPPTHAFHAWIARALTGGRKRSLAAAE